MNFQSGTSYHFSDKTEVPNSGWRYMPAYLKKVEFIKKNEAEANMIAELCEKMGHKEEQHFCRKTKLFLLFYWNFLQMISKMWTMTQTSTQRQYFIVIRSRRCTVMWRKLWRRAIVEERKWKRHRFFQTFEINAQNTIRQCIH